MPSVFYKYPILYVSFIRGSSEGHQRPDRKSFKSKINNFWNILILRLHFHNYSIFIQKGKITKFTANKIWFNSIVRESGVEMYGVEISEGRSKIRVNIDKKFSRFFPTLVHTYLCLPNLYRYYTAWAAFGQYIFF